MFRFDGRTKEVYHLRIVCIFFLCVCECVAKKETKQKEKRVTNDVKVKDVHVASKRKRSFGN